MNRRKPECLAEFCLGHGQFEVPIETDKTNGPQAVVDLAKEVRHALQCITGTEIDHSFTGASLVNGGSPHGRDHDMRYFVGYCCKIGQINSANQSRTK